MLRLTTAVGFVLCTTFSVIAEEKVSPCVEIVASSIAADFEQLQSGSHHLDVIQNWRPWGRDAEQLVSLNWVAKHTAFNEVPYDSSYWSEADISGDTVLDVLVASEFLQGNREGNFRKLIDVRAYCLPNSAGGISFQHPCSMISFDGMAVVTTWSTGGESQVERLEIPGQVARMRVISLENETVLVTLHRSMLEGTPMYELLVWSLVENSFKAQYNCRLES